MNHQAIPVAGEELRRLRLKERALTWVASALVVFALLLLYAVLRANDEAVSARAELEQRKAVACPSEIRGRPFVFSAYEHISMDRPGSARLSCWYRAVKP